MILQKEQDTKKHTEFQPSTTPAILLKQQYHVVTKIKVRYTIIRAMPLADNIYENFKSIIPIKVHP